MSLKDYIDSSSFEITAFAGLANLSSRLVDIEKNKFGDLNNYQLAIIGVPEDRESLNKGTSQAPSFIREELYKLYKPSDKVKIIDLGNVKAGNHPSDTAYALAEIVSILHQHKIVPIIIGGAKNLIYGNYMAYHQKKRMVNMLSIEPRIELTLSNDNYLTETYIRKIVLQDNCSLFNFTNLGYQSYYTPVEEIELMNRMNFDFFRLGLVRSNISQTEPLIRDSDIVSIDISSIKQSDAPGHYNSSPNGLYSEEICQIARYAGISDRLSSFGIYDYNPTFDINKQTAKLAAQIIWFFIEGFLHRKNEYPTQSIDYCKKFIVNIDSISEELVFYKSPKTERWWVEIPMPNTKSEEPFIISCSYEDYRKACGQEIPEKWLRYFQKIN